MSWTPSSKGVALVVSLAVVLVAVGGASAYTLTVDGATEESRVGTPVNATVVIEDPFQELPNSWTLKGETEANDVSWTVTVLQQGNTINQTTYGSKTFEQELSLDNGGDTVRIEIEGTAPPVENFSYAPEERFVLMEVVRVSGNNENTLNTTTVHHYTNESEEARTKIEAAEQAINETGGNAKAESQLNRSISAYNNGNFPNAISLAESAKQQAESAQQSQQMLQYALYGGGGLLVLVVLGGGVYWYRSQQESYNKLQ